MSRLNPLRRKSIFMHIQKTAGTTIVDIARNHCGGSYASHDDFLNHPVETIGQNMFISGHFGYAYARQFMADRYSFTFLREPEERVISFYYYCKRQNPEESYIYKLAAEYDLETFLQAGLDDRKVYPLIWNNQTWQLACGFLNPEGTHIYRFTNDQLYLLAREHLHDFSHVGLTETFETDRDIILRALKLPVPKARLASNISGQRPQRGELSAEARRLLGRLTELDRQIYDYTVGMKSKVQR